MRVAALRENKDLVISTVSVRIQNGCKNWYIDFMEHVGKCCCLEKVLDIIASPLEYFAKEAISPLRKELKSRLEPSFFYLYFCGRSHRQQAIQSSSASMSKS